MGCVGLFDTERLVLYREQDVVWGVWDCLLLKDWCCTGNRTARCALGSVGLFPMGSLMCGTGQGGTNGRWLCLSTRAKDDDLLVV